MIDLKTAEVRSISQALSQYYQRIASNDVGVAVEGFQKQPIPFLIILDDTGRFIDIQDTRTGDGKKKIAREFIVPKAVKKTSAIAANLLWDVPAYVFGIPKPDAKKDEAALKKRAIEQHQDFIKNLKEAFQYGI